MRGFNARGFKGFFFTALALSLTLAGMFGTVKRSLAMFACTGLPDCEPYSTDVTIASREMASLSPIWRADTQTADGTIGVDNSAHGYSVRNILSGSSINGSGVMVRLKFTADPSSSLTLGPAFFGPRNGSSPNYASAPTQLYFDNGTVPTGSTDPIGSTAAPGTNTGVVIPAGHHVWTNWFEFSPSAVDYLVSAYVESGSATKWTPSPAGPVQSYRISGSADTGSSLPTDWSLLPGYSQEDHILATAELAAWQNTGTATSQVYDTKITDPAYGQLSWIASNPAGTTLGVKVRTAANADMSDAPAWDSLAVYSASPASLSGLANLRYVQFQIVLSTASPYISFPQVRSVKITWPGQTALVEFSGYYTKKPNYGIFKVLVDGVQPVKSLEVKISAQDVYRGRTYAFSQTTEQKPMNTNK